MPLSQDHPDQVSILEPPLECAKHPQNPHMHPSLAESHTNTADHITLLPTDSLATDANLQQLTLGGLRFSSSPHECKNDGHSAKSYMVIALHPKTEQHQPARGLWYG